MMPQPPLKLLIVEDDVDLGANLCDHFTARGHYVDLAADGKAGLHLAATENFDAILLDLMLPGLDGIELIHRLREEIGRTTPILVISARDTVSERIAGLEAGADDYLVKPFALAEAEARMLALVRRARQTVAKSRLCIGQLVYDNVILRAAWAGRPIDLAPPRPRPMPCAVISTRCAAPSKPLAHHPP
jgi:DNA-binding response OmpR family regulator